MITNITFSCQIPKKKCLVPICQDTDILNPDKIFVMVPRHDERRKQWFTTIFGAGKEVHKTTNQYVCEDHFDLMDDAENFMQYKTIGYRLRMKKEAVPHKNLREPLNVGERQFSTAEKKRKQENILTFKNVACRKNQLKTRVTTSRKLHKNKNSNQLQLQSEETVNYLLKKLEEMFKDKYNFEDKITIKCPFCDEIFSQFSLDMKQHVKSHIVIGENHCTVCNRSFKREYDFKYHMSSHLGIIEIYKCSLCSKSYRNRDSLRRHMRLQDSEHLEAFRAECLKNEPIINICKDTSTFTTENDLVRHMNKHEKNNFDSSSSTNTEHQTEMSQYGNHNTKQDVACTRNQLQTDNEVLSPQNSNTTLSENTETGYNFEEIYIKSEPCEEYFSHCEVKMEDEKEITIKEEFVYHNNQDRQIYESMLQETSQGND